MSNASGFGSLSRLKAIFQKKFGMSMRDYRKLQNHYPPKRLENKKVCHRLAGAAYTLVD